MSKIIASAAIRGAHKIAKQAEEILTRAINEKGEDCRVEFPNTGYYMPIIYSMTGKAVEKLADFKDVMQEVKDLLPPQVDDDFWVPYLGHALDAGMATLFAEETIEACKYLIGPNPVDGIWLGAADDVILRERGIQFVDGTAPGFAAIAGAAPDVETAVDIARKLQERCLYVFMSAHNNGTIRFYVCAQQRHHFCRAARRRRRAVRLGNAAGTLRPGNHLSNIRTRLCQPGRT
jgi:acetyl-CoA synthase